MQRSVLWLCFLTYTLSFVACTTDNVEDLLRAKAESDSLNLFFPTIQVVSPQQGDTVETPFTITYQTENWDISPNGRHIQYFINEENKGYHFQENNVTIPTADTGSVQFALELAREDFSLTGILDSVRLYVKPPPPSTFSLTVNQGTGSGNYPEGAEISISALPADNQVFTQWNGDVAFVNNITDSATRVTMPSENIELTATFTLAAVSFETDIKPIIQANCLSCHDGLFSPILISCDDVNTFANAVRDRITDAQNPMPPSGLMPQNQIDAIITWIAQGSNCDE